MKHVDLSKIAVTGKVHGKEVGTSFGDLIGMMISFVHHALDSLDPIMDLDSEYCRGCQMEVAQVAGTLIALGAMLHKVQEFVDADKTLHALTGGKTDGQDRQPQH